MRSARPLLALVVAAAFLLAPSAQAAPGKLIAKASGSGLPTVTSTTGRALQPRTLLIRITADPSEPVQVDWNTSCARGAKGKVREGNVTTPGSATFKIKKGFKRPDDCLIDVLAGYENAAQGGTIKIEVFARGRDARRG